MAGRLQARRWLFAVSTVSVLALCQVGLAPARVVGSAQVGGRTIATEVRVTFTDRTIRVFPPNHQSGRTTFIVHNRGKKVHVLLIEGPRVKRHTAKLRAGHSASLTVRLRPGTYVLSDPVGLGPYKAVFLDVIRATVMTAGGGESVVTPPVPIPAICGYNP